MLEVMRVEILEASPVSKPLMTMVHATGSAFSGVISFGSTIETTHIKDRLILPGFIDGHVHVPQTRVLGAYSEQLLPWLLTWMFPEERKDTDRAYADEGTRKFFDNLLASLAHRVARRKVCGRPVLYRIWPVLGHASPGSVVLRLSHRVPPSIEVLQCLRPRYRRTAHGPLGLFPAASTCSPRVC